jgi:hypothetical protein
MALMGREKVECSPDWAGGRAGAFPYFGLPLPPELAGGRKAALASHAPRTLIPTAARVISPRAAGVG